MNPLHSLRLPLILAVIAMVGIVGMLLFDGVGNAASLVLAAVPLFVGWWAWWSQREG
jgi:xanthosine utilization system XapX-like protein